MKKAILTLSTDLSYYGGEATEEDKATMDALMAEYLEKLGYEVETRAGLEPRLDLSDVDPAVDDGGDTELIRARAWEYACAASCRE